MGMMILYLVTIALLVCERNGPLIFHLSLFYGDERAVLNRLFGFGVIFFGGRACPEERL